MEYPKFKISSELQAELEKILGEGARVSKNSQFESEEDFTLNHVNCRCIQTYYITGPNEKSRLGYWQQNQLDGCCGIQVYANFRGNARTGIHDGIGALQNKIAIWIAKTDGYSKLIATEVVSRGAAAPYIWSLKIFEKNGWSKAEKPFRNRRTGNDVQMFEILV